MFVPVPPKSSDDGPQPDADPALERDLATVVGRNADYYLRAWRPVLTGQSEGYGLNKAAFFLGPLWLAYRRMYLTSVLYYVVFFALFVVEWVVCRVALGLDGIPFPIDFITGLALNGALVACGNRWYLAHVQRVVAEVDARQLPEEKRRVALAARGGTDPIGGLAVVVGCFVAGAVLAVAYVIAVVWLVGLVRA